MYSMLPKKTDEGYKLIYSKVADPDPDKYIFTEQLKLYDMNVMMDLITNGTSEGNVILLDMKDFTIGHMAKMNLLTQKKFLLYVQVLLSFHAHFNRVI